MFFKDEQPLLRNMAYLRFKIFQANTEDTLS